MKLLLDENLSPEVARELRDLGIDAVHVRDRGLLGASDRAVFERAYEEDRVVVTCNVEDFRALASAVELHCGLILLHDAAVTRSLQLRILQQVLVHLAERDPINTIFVHHEDGEITEE